MPILDLTRRQRQQDARYGIGLRRAHFDHLDKLDGQVDFLEIVSENFMRFGGRPRQVLERLKDELPILPHGVGLSVGGPDPINEDYLDRLRDLVTWLDAPWFSDHLAYSSAFGVEYHDLLPLPFSEEALDHVVARIGHVQERIGRPFLVENPSYYVQLPGAEMSEAEFTREVLERADCGLLLDVNNVYVNARNHGYDAHAFIDAMPAHRVVQMHMAGHDATGSFIVDSHGAHIDREVFDLYAYTVERLGPTYTLLEWDNNIPPLDVLLAENRQVRAVGERALGLACTRRVA